MALFYTHVPPKSQANKSCCFRHNKGECPKIELVEEAENYAWRLKATCRSVYFWPLERLEPNTVMVDFIRYLMEERQIRMVISNYYLGKDETCGDNSNHGNHIIDFDEIDLHEELMRIKPIFDTKEAVKALKAELNEKLHGVEFSVRTRKICVGDGILVSWKHGPSKEDVEKITVKYEIIWKDDNRMHIDKWSRRVMLHRILI